MEGLFKFINSNPTAFHVVETCRKELLEAKYTELFENEDWNIKKGGKYFVTRNDSSIIAFYVPKKAPRGFHIFAAHTDSPCFRIKEKPEMCFEDNYVRLNVEKYGGMILSSWLDRPVSVAGRVIVKEDGKPVTRLVNIDKDLMQIPNAAIHMNGELNKGYTYSVQSDMLPLFSDISGKGKFDEFIAEAMGIKKEDILGKDLFVYSRQKAQYMGLHDEFVIAPRLDDQACCYAGLKGLLESKAGEYVKVLALFDNEEVGSGTKQGADSTLLEDTLYRISDGLSMSRTDYLKALADSFAISADNAHSVHPALAGKADPTNRPYMNKGVVLKYNGNQRYATDAVSAAYFKLTCEEAGVAVQTYVNQSDIMGGSTLGNISTSHVSIKTADIGLAQLAMHSSCETMGSKDLGDMIALCKVFFSK